jgi:protein-tyrosine-phosphatase
VGLAEFPGFDHAMRLRLAAAVDRLAEEWDGIYDRPAITALVEESAESLSTRGITPFVHILAERFARERLRAQARAEGRLDKTTPEVLFVSLTGGGRAQIAAAFLARRAGDALIVHSAGSDSSSEIEENVRAAMGEVGFDLADAYTKPLTPEVLAAADIVVTMGRSVGAVQVPETVRHVDWRVGDPAGAELDEVRRVCEDIERRVDALAQELVAAESRPAARVDAPQSSPSQ